MPSQVIVRFVKQVLKLCQFFSILAFSHYMEKGIYSEIELSAKSYSICQKIVKIMPIVQTFDLRFCTRDISDTIKRNLMKLHGRKQKQKVVQVNLIFYLPPTKSKSKSKSYHSIF